MKRFAFNLQKILELRKFREEEARHELGRAIGILTELQNGLRRNAEARRDAVEQRFAGLRVEGGLSPETSGMFAIEGYLQRLRQEAELLMEEAARAELVVEEKRTLYREASGRLQVMEKLREKRAGEYRKEMFATETKETDDLWRDRREVQSAEDGTPSLVDWTRRSVQATAGSLN